MKTGLSILAIGILSAVAAAAQTPASGQQPAAKPAQQSGSKTDNALPEMKTQTYKGVLVDASCSGGDQCGAKANTTQFGLKTGDGKVMKFDLVGNQRAQDELKNNKKWSEAAGSGKAINAKVSGAVSGEKLIVSSIH